MFDRRRVGRPTITVVAAARPNFMKVGPVVRALALEADVDLVHTGQHYDNRMSADFFRDLSIPEPNVNLEVGSGLHGEQTAAVLVKFEKYLLERQPDAVVVVGDVNSTVAAALAAVKLHIPVAHVEAGLRSRDWAMPEEINRLLTDRISRWLFTPSSDADVNLLAEGVPPEWIHLVGNVMIDTLYDNLPRATERGHAVREELGLDGDYGLLTLHRPSNVDEASSLQELMAVLGDLAGDHMRLVFPAHPRTAERLRTFGVDLPEQVQMVEPLNYLDFIGLVAESRVVLTDSGGVQEETSVLGVPCLTLRDNTERPITSELGTNILVGTDPEQIAPAFRTALESERVPRSIPLWDGKAGERVAQLLLRDLRESPSRQMVNVG
jgi:UDP-N-acetylglucosamine 2-epimerase (non-hydrolysing)